MYDSIQLFCIKSTFLITIQRISHSHLNLNNTQHKMTVKELKEYFRNHTRVKRQQAIKLYLIKHNLALVEEVSLQMFLQTLIPYTPNCLRQVNQTIGRQLQTQHLDMTVEQIYNKLIVVQTQNLYLIRLLQREVNLSWSQIQTFIVQDIVEKGKKIDLIIKQQTDIIYIRKWMQLWVNVDEYEVLNLMRFFNGGSEENILRLYQNNVSIQMKCTCDCMKLPNKNKSISKSNTLNTEYYSHGEDKHYNNVNINKYRFQTEIDQIGRMKQQDSTQQYHYKQNKKQKSSSSSNQINKLLKHKSSSISSSQLTSVELFLQYVNIVIQSEKYLTLHRNLLKPYKKQVDQLLHDILSKKNPSTKVQKIMLYIDKFINKNQDKFQLMIQTYGQVKIQNNILLSIFSSQIVGSSTGQKLNVNVNVNSDKNQLISKTHNNKKVLASHQIIKITSSMLYKFINSKFRLIKLSYQIMKYPLDQLIKGILLLNSHNVEKQPQHLNRFIDHKQRKHKKQITKSQIQIQNLKQMIQTYSTQKINKRYLHLLIKHLGDGNIITKKTLLNVFKKQSQQFKINNES